MPEAGRTFALHPRTYVRFGGSERSGRTQVGDPAMTKRFDEEVRVERDAGMPSVFEWRGKRYQVVDVIGKWRIEGRWWADGRDREYWRGGGRGGGGGGPLLRPPKQPRAVGRAPGLGGRSPR